MLLELDLESDRPLYQQLVNAIIKGIATGELQPGESLPSVRMLAQDLGINMHTVNKAYHLLKADGFLHIHRQKGVTIASVLPTADRAFHEKTRADLEPIIAEAVSRGMDEDDFLKLCRSLFAEMRAKRTAKK